MGVAEAAHGGSGESVFGCIDNYLGVVMSVGCGLRFIALSALFSSSLVASHAGVSPAADSSLPLKLDDFTPARQVGPAEYIRASACVADGELRSCSGSCVEQTVKGVSYWEARIDCDQPSASSA